MRRPPLPFTQAVIGLQQWKNAELARRTERRAVEDRMAAARTKWWRTRSQTGCDHQMLIQRGLRGSELADAMLAAARRHEREHEQGLIEEAAACLLCDDPGTHVHTLSVEEGRV